MIKKDFTKYEKPFDYRVDNHEEWIKKMVEKGFSEKYVKRRLEDTITQDQL